MSATARPATDRVAAVRRFNRFYTRLVGALGEGHLESEFSLTEARVLFELANRDDPTAAAIGRELDLDAGYLSRLLRGFETRGLVERAPSASDGRQSHLRLTSAGRAAADELRDRAVRDVARMLAPLGDATQRRLLHALGTVESLLGAPRPRPAEPFVLRPHQPGDMGWVVHRHGVLYAREYGWDERFEALVAEIVAAFIRDLDPRRERCWIAERDGEPVGSVFVVRHPERERVAKLRLLLVEPSARGLGVGARLVSECTRFARQAGYHTLTLWTNSVLTSARRLYEAEGYRLVHEAAHHSFGHDLVEQVWELALDAETWLWIPARSPDSES